MNAWKWGIAAAVATAACSPPADRTAGTPLEQGRTYTDWLYRKQYQQLWERFSPEMRQTFGSVTVLASFAGNAVQRFGAERGAAEQVAEEEPFRVYTRRVSFDRSRDTVLIQWSLAKNGQVTGLVVRPVPTETQPQ